MSWQLREPRPTDADTLAELHVETWREAYGHLLPASFFTEEFRAGRRRMWEQVIAAPRAGFVVRVAEADDGALIGFAWAGDAADSEAGGPAAKELYAIYVWAAWYGTGVGQALLDAVIEDSPATLWVAAQNPRAIAFYERNGFALDGTQKTDPTAPLITDARMVR